MLWVVLVAVLAVSMSSGDEAHLDLIDEAVSLISLNNQLSETQANTQSAPEEADTKTAPDYGDDSPKNDGADAYTSIPNFVFQHMAEPVAAQTLHDCQNACNRLPQCRSFSFRAPTAADQKDSKDTTAPEGSEEKAEDDADGKTPAYLPGLCMWSMESIHYNDEWIFYTKAKDVDWQGKPHLTTENFHAFPGLEYQESSYAELTGTKFVPCRTKCAADPKCEAFSFNKEKQLCRHAGAGVHYDRTFTYYEKRQSAHSSPANGGEEALEQHSDALAAQEKSSKKSIQNMISVTKARTTKRETRHLKAFRVERNSKENKKKSAQLDMANQRLNTAKDHLSGMKSENTIKQAFDKAYFESAGAAYEKKSKEVKLKTQEIRQKDIFAAKESFVKSGEFQAKKAKSAHERKVEDAEIGIQTTKERISKVTNKQLKKKLDAEASRIAGMGMEEAGSIETIKRKHRKKIADLKDQVYEAQQELKAVNAAIDVKSTELSRLEQTDKDDASEQKHAYQKSASSLTLLANMKIRQRAIAAEPSL